MHKPESYCAVNDVRPRSTKYLLGVRRPSGTMIVAEFFFESQRNLVLQALEAPQAMRVLIEQALMAAE